MPQAPDDRSILEAKREQLQAKINFLCEAPPLRPGEPSIRWAAERNSLMLRLTAVQERISRLEASQRRPRPAPETFMPGTIVPRSHIADFVTVPCPDSTADDDEACIGDEIMKAAARAAANVVERSMVERPPNSVNVSTTFPPSNERSTAQSPCDHSTCQGLNFCAESIRQSIVNDIHPGLIIPAATPQQLSDRVLNNEIERMWRRAERPNRMDAVEYSAYVEQRTALENEARRRRQEDRDQREAAERAQCERLAREAGIPRNLPTGCTHSMCWGWTYCRESRPDSQNVQTHPGAATRPAAPDYVAPPRSHVDVAGIERRLRELQDSYANPSPPERIFTEIVTETKAHPEKTLKGKAQIKAILEMLDKTRSVTEPTNAGQRATKTTVEA